MGQSFYKMQRALEEFSTVYPDASLRTLQIFLAVADHPGVTALELAKKINPEPSQSSLSRHIMLLSEMTWHGKKPGLDLVMTEPDPDDRRSKKVELTRRGEALRAAIERHVAS